MEKYKDLKEVRKELEQAVRYTESSTVAVKVYDCDETGEQTYDVEVNFYIDGRYEEGWVTDIAYEGELKQAQKRAAAVLKTVKKWFEYNARVQVQEAVEVYRA